MDLHAVPREIVSFEFKLIGFMSVRQFLYIVFFGGLAIIAYFIRIIPYVNYIAAVVLITIGVIFAFVKYNDRPIDILIKKFLVHALLDATQYRYKKNNQPPHYLVEAMQQMDEKMISQHQLAKNQLNNYLLKKTNQAKSNNNAPQIAKTNINVTNNPIVTSSPLGSDEKTPVGASNNMISEQKPLTSSQKPVVSNPPSETVVPVPPTSKTPVPFISGTIKNSKNIPLNNILLYFKTNHGSIVRLVKTNSNGVFATYHPLPPGEYIIEPKDVNGNYFFDKINIIIDQKGHPPISIYSREIV